MTWQFNQLNASYGRVFQYENPKAGIFEISWDAGCQKCYRIPLYGGASVSLTNSLVYRDYGVKSYYNLVSWSFAVSKTFRMYPIILVQEQYKKYRVENSPEPYYHTTVGGGVHGISVSKSDYSFRTSFQVYYDITNSHLTKSQRIVYEFKIGMGLNLR